MDGAFFYGLSKSMQGRHAQQIADWEDYAENLENAADELARKLKAAKTQGADHARQAREYKVIADVLVDSVNKVYAERNAITKDANQKINQLRTSLALEEGQRALFQTVFLRVLEYVPGLKDDMMRTGSRDIWNPAFSAYEDVLRRYGISPEMLEGLKAKGYTFIPPSKEFGNTVPNAPPGQVHQDKVTRTFASRETIQLREKVADLKGENGKLIDDRFQWAYQATLNKAEAEGHKAVLDLVRSSPRDADIDTPTPDVPAPDGQLDSLSTAAFRHAYVSHLLVAGATRTDLLEFVADTGYELPFPVTDYMDWVAALSPEDVPSEGLEVPAVPR